jgi:mRNA interferase YafQ
MTKPPSSRRAVPPRSAEFTKRFLKDWERLNRSGRYDMVRLKEVVLLLIANDAPLGPEWLDHGLKGNWANHRECHVGGDFLVVYRIEEDTVVFIRAGTHAELFD